MNIMTTGVKGPALLQDFVFLDEMAHFDNERIPERVVHAKGAGESSLSVGGSTREENPTQMRLLYIK